MPLPWCVVVCFNSTMLAVMLLALGSAGPADASTNGPRIEIETQKVVLAGVPFDLKLIAKTASGDVDVTFSSEAKVTGVTMPAGAALTFEAGRLTISKLVLTESGKVEVTTGETRGDAELRVIPAWLSLLPPLLAIVIALVLREVLLALFGGILLGAIFIAGGPFVGLGRALDTYVVGSLGDKSHAAIVLFSLTLGGMVGVMSRAGGTEGIVAQLARFARARRGGQIATWAMGVFIFFDDYANTLIVGNTMRPLTDKLRLSREKLSFIVDATAAPVTSIALISSWVGFQVGLIDQSFKNLGRDQDAYLTFLSSVPYASYSVLMLVFVMLVGWTLRDFGPMRRAEERATLTGQVLAEGAQPLVDDKALDLRAAAGMPLRWYNAGIPIAVVITTTLLGLYYGGCAALGDAAHTARLGEIIGAADSFAALMWASFAGAAVAIILAVGQRLLSLKEALEAWLGGVKAMVIAMIILVLAWAIGSVCGDLQTAAYVVHITAEILSPSLLPVLTFILAAFIAFSTGTSWATMAILTPIVIPMAATMTTGQPEIAEPVMLGTIGAVLSGSVFGDHCSPISDTTIMSSMTSGADHIDHVRTQLPYAVTVALVACLVGYLPAGFGWSPWLSIPIGVAMLVAALFVLGKPVRKEAEPD